MPKYCISHSKSTPSYSPYDVVAVRDGAVFGKQPVVRSHVHPVHALDCHLTNLILSSVEKRVCFLWLMRSSTVTWSKILLARLIRSIRPLVMGSKVPGKMHFFMAISLRLSCAKWRFLAKALTFLG